MYLEITAAMPEAPDLGYLLHKNPRRPQTFDLAFGKVLVFYPEVSPQRCSAGLLLDLDPVGLVRQRRMPAGDFGALAQYVNDRPYTASSFLSVAIAQVYGSALAGRSKERPTLAQTPIPLSARLTSLPSRGGAEMLEKLFVPLGYRLSARRLPLDTMFPEWGESRYFDVELSQTVRLQDLLAHLYVLIPVLDDEKHYWIGEDEVEKLLRHGEAWLSSHPQRALIVERYLRRRRKLVTSALAQLAEDDPEPDETAEGEASSADPVAAEAAVAAPAGSQEETLSLNDLRHQAVLEALHAANAKRVLDLGCGEGKLLRRLVESRKFREIVGMDVAFGILERAADRLGLHYDSTGNFSRGPTETPPAGAAKVVLFQSSLLYRDARLAGFDAAALVEVIEHQDPPRLAALERSVFEYARPRRVVVTTPNREYNVLFPTLPAGKFRHADHRFEWTRFEFQTWADAVSLRFGYTVSYAPIGPVDDMHGAPTQMAVFDRREAAE